MSAPALAVPAETIDGLRTGDMKSLEAIFHQLFPSLLTEADASLQSGTTAASRAVEQVFARLWASRDTIRDAAALDAAVQKTMHDVILREKSRIASVQRLEKNEGTQATPRTPDNPAASDPNEVWTRVERLVRPAGPRPDSGQRADQARHAAASHMASTMPKKNARLKATLGALTVVALAVFGIMRLNKMTASLDVNKELSDPQVATTNAPDAQRGSLTLDDSSAVLLGPDSHLGVPPGFNTKVRAVSLDGTAQIKVFAGRKDSFDLRIKKTAITATDATIEVRGDSGQPVVVRARAGSANVSVGKQHRTLATGEAVHIDLDGTMRPATPSEIDNAVGWTDGDFVADSVPLATVVSELRRWYGLILFIEDKRLLTRPVTMRASLSSQDQAIKALEKGGKLSFGYDPTGKNMELRDAGR